jgi:hypothetical protein
MGSSGLQDNCWHNSQTQLQRRKPPETPVNAAILTSDPALSMVCRDEKISKQVPAFQKLIGASQQTTCASPSLVVSTNTTCQGASWRTAASYKSFTLEDGRPGLRSTGTAVQMQQSDSSGKRTSARVKSSYGRHTCSSHRHPQNNAGLLATANTVTITVPARNKLFLPLSGCSKPTCGHAAEFPV